MLKVDDPPQDAGHKLSINTGLVQGGTYLAGGAMGLSGGTMNYFTRLLQVPFGEVEPLAADVACGCDGLLLFPGLSGERAPYWKQHFNGAMIGLRLDHDHGHILRAVMEGTALRLRSLLKVLQDSGRPAAKIRIVGGNARWDLWNQIHADVTGLTLEKQETNEATLLGSAFFCLKALDPRQPHDTIQGRWMKTVTRYRPDPERKADYDRLWVIFDTFLRRNTPLFEQLDQFQMGIQPVAVNEALK
jgi:sugar (pentulose or hexulose) kinase